MVSPRPSRTEYMMNTDEIDTKAGARDCMK
jgi:hypothetical protein